MIGADCEELVVKYLAQTFANVGIEMPTSPPLPYVLVTMLPTSTGSWVTESNLVSVHVFAADRTAASDAARTLHSVMNPWVFTPKLNFSLSNGVSTGIDRFCIVERPAWHDYDNPNLQRYCGRYRIDLRMNQTT